MMIGALGVIESIETGVIFNPLNPRVLENPYPFYQVLRSRDPVHRSRIGGGWLFTRYSRVIMM